MSLAGTLFSALYLLYNMYNVYMNIQYMIFDLGIIHILYIFNNFYFQPLTPLFISFWSITINISSVMLIHSFSYSSLPPVFDPHHTQKKIFFVLTFLTKKKSLLSKIIFPERDLVFATNSNFPIPIYFFPTLWCKPVIFSLA